MNFRLKRYQKDFPHSYSFGVFATLELLACCPDQVIGVAIASKGERSEGVAKLRAECARRAIPLEVDDAAIERLSPKESHLAVGVFHKYEAQLDPAANHVVLVNPADMGNLGTIARTMAGFGFRDLALIRPAADAFDPRAIRASMGALFRLSVCYFDSFENYRTEFENHLYPLMTDGDTDISAAQFAAPYALVFGSESAGLPPDFRGMGMSLSIPHGNQIDSLNLSVAVGIALYAASKSQSS